MLSGVCGAVFVRVCVLGCFCFLNVRVVWDVLCDVVWRVFVF